MRHLYRKPEEVNERLEQLGLTEELLLNTVRAGLSGWLNCTPNHPPSYPGIHAWAEMVRELREQLLPRGWDRLNDRNLPLTVNQSTNTAITASSGDECTGIEHLEPRTRNPKGVTTRQKVKENAEQLGLFTETDTPTDEFVAEVEKWNTWLLLSYRDLSLQTIRCELSKPIGIGIDGRVDGWDERIILAEIPFDGDDVLLTRGGGDGGNNADGSVEYEFDAIDVEVKRRA